MSWSRSQSEPDADGGELKPVLEVTGRLPEPLLDLAVWIAEGTASTLARAVALVVPPRPPKRRLKPVAETVSEDRPVTLTEAQQAAVDAIERARTDGAHEVLLHGVTGSGKTEVYLRAIERELADGRGAIVLVPEIALTPQTAARFQARFGDTVAVLHSALTPARRGAEHRRIADGEARVVVGARSAVFAAMPRLGMIVVDEEHDASYKHESDPRYDARRVAAKRARLEGALVVFGSATPRPESWHGIPRRIALPGRVGGPLPAVEVVDLRHDGGYPLTRPLRDALGRIEDAGGRAILLQNRRGSAAAIHCRSCGHGWRCPRCDVSLSLHGEARLVCHHCGHSERPPRACPDVRLGRPHPDRLRHAGGGGRAGRPVPGAVRAAAGRRRGGAAATSRRPRWRRSAQQTGRCWWARSWWPRGTTCPASRWLRCWTPRPGWRCRTSGRRSARSPC